MASNEALQRRCAVSIKKMSLPTLQQASSFEVKKIEFELKKRQLMSIKEKLRCDACGLVKHLKEYPLCHCSHVNTHQYCIDCAIDVAYRCENSESKYSSVICGQTQYVVLTELWEDYPSFCKHEKHGCQEILMKREMKIHEVECTYKQINCAHLGCKAFVTYMNFFEHYDVSHPGIEVIELGKMPTILTQEFDFDGEKDFTIANTRFSGFDKTFFSAGIKRGNFVYMWIYFLGNPDEAKHFFCEFNFGTQRGQMLQYYGQVRSLEEKVGPIIDEQTAFVIGVPVLKRLLEDNDEVEYSLKIRNMKEECKDDNYESGISDASDDEVEVTVLK